MKQLAPVLGGAIGSKALAAAFGGSPLAGNIGWFLGQAVVGSFMDGQQVTNEGARLSDLSVQSSAYGVPIPLVFGTIKLAGNVIWARPLHEVRSESSETSGKGASEVTQNSVTYKYYGSFAVGLCEGPIQLVSRIWANGELVFEKGKWLPTGTVTSMDIQGVMPDDGVDIAPGVRLYFGTETQRPSSYIESFEGVGEVPAHRGLAYVVFEEFALERYGNAVPSFEFEISNYVAVEEPETSEASVPNPGIPNGASWNTDYDEASGMLAMRVSPDLDWWGMPLNIVQQPLYIQRQTDAGLMIDQVDMPDLSSTYGMHTKLATAYGSAYVTFGLVDPDTKSYSEPYYLKFRLDAAGEHRLVSARLPNGLEVGSDIVASGELAAAKATKPRVAFCIRYNHEAAGSRSYILVPEPKYLEWNALDYNDMWSKFSEHLPMLTDNGAPFNGFDSSTATAQGSATLLYKELLGTGPLTYATFESRQSGLVQQPFSVPTLARPISWASDGSPSGGWVVCQAGIRTDVDAFGAEVKTWVGKVYSFNEAGVLQQTQTFEQVNVAIPSVIFIDPQRDRVVFPGAVVQLWDL